MVDVLTSHRRRRHRLRVFNEIEDEIDKLRAINNQEDDTPLWNHMRQARSDCSWSNGVWFNQYTPKYSFLVWVAIRNRLQTCDRMQLWNNGINTLCVLCQEQQETCQHLFFRCRERNGRRHGEAPKDEKNLIKYVDRIIRLKLLAVKGKGKKYLEEGLWV